jgi:hypothetical protein
MVTPGRDCRIERRDGVEALVLEGDWRLERTAEIDRRLVELAPRCAASRSSTAARSARSTPPARWCCAGACAMPGSTRRRSPRATCPGATPASSRSSTAGSGAGPAATRRRAPGSALLARVGVSAATLGAMLAGHVSFLGRTALEVGRAIVRPGRLRWRELGAQLGSAGRRRDTGRGAGDVPDRRGVRLLLGLQAAQFGANIFVVDGVALGMTREFSPLIVATIVAGRSGAAFTAQLGTMKLTEEIDAIRTLGLSAEQVLVVPRVLALVLALPLLVFVGDVAGWRARWSSPPRCST